MIDPVISTEHCHILDNGCCFTVRDTLRNKEYRVYYSHARHGIRIGEETRGSYELDPSFFAGITTLYGFVTTMSFLIYGPAGLGLWGISTIVYITILVTCNLVRVEYPYKKALRIAVDTAEGVESQYVVFSDTKELMKEIEKLN